MKTFFVETYGCQMNAADSETVGGILARAGYRPASEPERADIVLVNTCAIRERAEERVLGRLSELARLKTGRPDMVLGVLGCMAQHIKEKVTRQIPAVDIVVGPDGYRRLPQLVAERNDEPYLEVNLSRTEVYADVAPLRPSGIRAWVSIMRGCDKFCTFCIVPYVRGRERSLPMADILRQLENLAAAGYKEVVFLGQTVNAYKDPSISTSVVRVGFGPAGGRPATRGSQNGAATGLPREAPRISSKPLTPADGIPRRRNTFAALLKKAAEIDGIERIRFTSPHPVDFDWETIEAMAENPKICPQLHLPLQSASNPVLAKMKRRYTIEYYDMLLDSFRRAVPNLAVSTDIIVGFPGESETDFRATYDYLAKTRYDSAFLFKYSPRPGTKAYEWENPTCGERSRTVPEEEKLHRLQAAIHLQEKISLEKNREWVGKTAEVLAEGPSRKSNDGNGDDSWFGKSPQFKTVVFKPKEATKPGDRIYLAISRATGHTLFGTGPN